MPQPSSFVVIMKTTGATQGIICDSDWQAIWLLRWSVYLLFFVFIDSTYYTSVLFTALLDWGRMKFEQDDQTRNHCRCFPSKQTCTLSVVFSFTLSLRSYSPILPFFSSSINIISLSDLSMMYSIHLPCALLSTTFPPSFFPWVLYKYKRWWC